LEKVLAFEVSVTVAVKRTLLQLKYN